MQKVKHQDVEHQLVETLSGLALNSNVVRLFFSSLRFKEDASEKNGAKLNVELTQCLAMPLVGFLHSAVQIEKFLRDEQVQKFIATACLAETVPPDLDLKLLRREPGSAGKPKPAPGDEDQKPAETKSKRSAAKIQ